MLENASPLMDIYREDGAARLNAFLLADSRTPGRRRHILHTPPLCTMEPDYLAALLEKQGLPEENRQRIRAYARTRREQLETILLTDTVHLELPRLTERAFAQFPPALPLSGLFYGQDVPYTYETYLAHLAQTEAFAAAIPAVSWNSPAAEPSGTCRSPFTRGSGPWYPRGSRPPSTSSSGTPSCGAAIERFVPPMVEE